MEDTAVSASSVRSASRAKGEAVRRPRQHELKMKARDVNLWYGEKQALFDVDLEIFDRSVTALIGPSGCGKSTFLRCLNRMNDVIDICRVEGDIRLDGEDIYAPACRSGAAARPRRHGVPEAEPVPQVDLRERRLWPAHSRSCATPRRELEEIVVRPA